MECRLSHLLAYMQISLYHTAWFRQYLFLVRIHCPLILQAEPKLAHKCIHWCLLAQLDLMPLVTLAEPYVLFLLNDAPSILTRVRLARPAATHTPRLSFARPVATHTRILTCLKNEAAHTNLNGSCPSSGPLLPSAVSAATQHAHNPCGRFARPTRHL